MTRFFSFAVTALTLALAGPVMAAEVDMSKATCKEVGALPAAKTIGIKSHEDRDGKPTGLRRERLDLAAAEGSGGTGEDVTSVCAG